MGIPQPLVVGRGINDVPIVTLTLSPRPETADRWNDTALYELAEKMRHELIKINNVGLTFIVGGRPDQIRIEPDPERLLLYGVTLNQLVEKIRAANTSTLIGTMRSPPTGRYPVVTGQTLHGQPDVGLLLLTARDGRPVYVKDVADIVVGGRPDDHRVWNHGKVRRRQASTPAPP